MATIVNKPRFLTLFDHEIAKSYGYDLIYVSVSEMNQVAQIATSRTLFVKPGNIVSFLNEKPISFKVLNKIKPDLINDMRDTFNLTYKEQLLFELSNCKFYTMIHNFDASYVKDLF